MRLPEYECAYHQMCLTAFIFPDTNWQANFQVTCLTARGRWILNHPQAPEHSTHPLLHSETQMVPHNLSETRHCLDF